jgi:hypothetical protein
MLIETQGGDSFLTANIQDWKASVRSHKNWRVIQQSSPKDLLSFLEETSKPNHSDTDSRPADRSKTRMDLERRRQSEYRQHRFAYRVRSKSPGKNFGQSTVAASEVSGVIDDMLGL